MFDGNILVVVAHPDDEVLGCGGTIAKLSQEREVDIVFVADGEGARGDAGDLDKRKAAARSAAECLGANPPKFLDFPDNRLDTVPFLDIVQAVETGIRRVTPSIVLTHHSGDLNIDHRLTHNAVMTACRPLPDAPVKTVLSFEVSSSTEWSLQSYGGVFTPNLFVDISDTLDRKFEALEAYATEMRPAPHARSVEAVRAIATARGASVGVAFAEAFDLQRSLVA